MARQADVSFLEDPVARSLLQSTIPSRLSYVWRDGSPRVVPIWFHWTGEEFLLGSPLKAPKMKVLASGSRVALTIDDEKWPYKALYVRGTARAETVDSVFPEYALIAKRYLGEEPGLGFVDLFRGKFPKMARIAIRPEWVGLLDMSRPTHFPSAWQS